MPRSSTVNAAALAAGVAVAGLAAAQDADQAKEQTVAEARSLTEEQNVQAALRLFAGGWGANEGWRAVWREAMAPDVASFFHSHPPTRGIEEVIAFNAGLFEGFPKLSVEVTGVVAEDDEVVVRGRLTGTHDGPFLGVPASGNAVDVPDVTMFRLADGRVTEIRYFTDLLAVMTAIGAAPAGE